MSLLDTIKGAREEAQEAASKRTTTKKEEASDAAGTDAAGSAQAGFSRRSAARAKPRREVAGSVRDGSQAKPKSEMTKEEKKAEREARRSQEDLVYDVKKTLLDNDMEYRRTQHVWWGMLIVGIVFTLASWAIMQYMNSNGGGENTAMVSVVLMVLAYVLVIGAFIYDLVKVRPLRNKANDKIAGMSKRRMQRVLEEEKERKASNK